MELCRPYSEACEQNKHVILEQLKKIFTPGSTVLEIGSGSGQHALHFARHLPDITWQPSDLLENLPGMNIWLDEAKLSNIESPLPLNVDSDYWPIRSADAIFGANIAHIMHWTSVQNLFRKAGEILVGNGLLCLYGPFNYGGGFTSPSNARFDAALKAHDPKMGIRNIEAINYISRRSGLHIADDISMPSHNRLLVWKRHSRLTGYSV